MTIKHPFYTSCLACITFIGPHSEALFSGTTLPTEKKHSRYYCELGYQQKNITVSQPLESAQPSSCQVSWQHNEEETIVLWDSQRTLDACKNSAAAIALRLKDRGWQCEFTHLSLQQ
ncbi:hypothetical protein ACVBE9_01185 [Eionea flava]